MGTVHDMSAVQPSERSKLIPAAAAAAAKTARSQQPHVRIKTAGLAVLAGAALSLLVIHPYCLY